MVCPVKNIGKTDRLIRLVVGLALVAAGLLFQITLGVIVGGVLLFTTITERCPLYMPFGLSSRRE